MSGIDLTPAKALRAGTTVIFLGLGVFILWATLTSIDGAIVANGQVTGQVGHQVVQHPDGGTVLEVHVRQGEAVVAGMPIVTLGDDDLHSQLFLNSQELFEVTARLDRLRSEVLGLETVIFSLSLLEHSVDQTEVADILAQEGDLFLARRETLEQTLSQLTERQRATDAIIQGLSRQVSASAELMELARAELLIQQSLLTRGLVSAQSVSSLQREIASLTGEIGQLEAAVAQAHSEGAGFEVERLLRLSSYQESALSEIRTYQPRLVELRQRSRTIRRQLSLLVLRAPTDGVIFDLQVNTIGGVLRSGEPAATIVPNLEPMEISIQIAPLDIDRVARGQAALVNFPNFGEISTPVLDGVVTVVAADAQIDSATGQRYFEARVALSDAAGEFLQDRALVAGMPVEVFIPSGSRSPASFLIRPFTEYLMYAFREE